MLFLHIGILFSISGNPEYWGEVHRKELAYEG